MADILLVDDDELYRELVETMLVRAGHAVIATRTGIEALGLLRQRPFDVLLTDLFMPDMDGVELVLSVRDTGCGIPIIGMTGGADGAVRPFTSTFLTFGAAEVLAKPITAGGLEDAIRLALRRG
jgi:CheY-like chemotaxis protein